MTVSRRGLLSFAGAVGGYGAVLGAMNALGIDPLPAAEITPPKLGPGVAKGTRVVVLGGGIAGLVSAYELRKAGAEVTLLEARDRPGGRNWSIRRGTRIDFTTGESQTCDWDEGLYFNSGPGRLPSHHRIMHGYLKEFGVPIEVEVNSTRSAFVLPKDGPPVQLRRVFNDTRGYVAELLAKCTRQGALDAALTPADKASLIEFMSMYGDLGKDGRYAGTARSGYKVRPAAGDLSGTPIDPLDLHTILNPALWAPLAFEEQVVMQPTMFQPKGGMDRIPYAFAERLKDLIRYQAVVSDITNLPNGVRVTYREGGGPPRTLTADYAIVTIPLPVLRQIPNNFSAPFMTAMNAIEYDHSLKIAFQSPRFWETEFEIYGGLSFCEGETGVTWYPSNDFNTPQGVLVSTYSSGKFAASMTAKSTVDQIATARATIERLHPGCSARMTKPISQQWRKVPFNLGPWAHIEEAQAAEYTALGRPEGRCHLAGDYLSHVSGWQEGAASSALRALSMIGQRIADAGTRSRGSAQAA